MITVVDSVNTDVSVGVPKLPKPGETVLGQDAVIGLGGKGANQAVAAARLGAQVALVACVGLDVFGRRARERLEQEHIDLSHLGASTSPTGLALVGRGGNAQNIIMVAPGANADLGSESLTAEMFQGSRLAMFQLEIPERTWRRVLKLAKHAGCTTLLNASPSGANATVRDFAGTDWLVVNELEAAQLLGRPQVATRAAATGYARALARHLPHCVITLGREGTVHAGAGRTVAVPARPVAAVDPTGAGDTFAGVLGVTLTEGADPETACVVANAAAARTTLKPGTTDAMPYRHEVATPKEER